MRRARLVSTLSAVCFAFPTLCQGFVTPSTSAVTRGVASSMQATPVSLITDVMEPANLFTADSYASAITGMASSTLMMAETEAWVQPMSLVLGPFLNLMSIGMVGACSHAHFEH